MSTTNETLAALLEGVAAARKSLADDSWTGQTYHIKVRALAVVESVVRSAMGGDAKSNTEAITYPDCAEKPISDSDRLEWLMEQFNELPLTSKVNRSEIDKDMKRK